MSKFEVFDVCDSVLQSLKLLRVMSISSKRLVLSISSKRLLELKFHRLYGQQYQLTSVLSNVSYVAVSMLLHFLCNHSSQLLRAMKCLSLDYLDALPHF
jgi:hypothetical protein